MSEVLNVSKSGYYEWQRNKDRLASKTAILDQEIETAFEKSKKNYGSPRIHLALQKTNISVSESTIARRMKALGLVARKPKRFKITTDSEHDMKIAPNIVNREFEVSEPGRVWVSDITYIRLQYRFVYLTTVIDLADRMVVGWNLSTDMTDKNTTIAALKKALKNRKIHSGLIFHSDRGVQYASHDFRKILTKNKCIQSMSRKGNCWDNAVAESFFKTIKSESLNRYQFENLEQVQSVIFRYIDGWYNTTRFHSANDGLAPIDKYHSLINHKLAA